MANYFVNRVVEFPGRIKLIPVAGEANTYDMSRAEGTVTTEGTRFNAEAFNEIANKIHAYGTCSSGASTTEKVVNCPGFVLEAGATISVKFTSGNSRTGACSLNVNNTTAAEIITIPRTAPVTESATTTTNIRDAWEAQQVKDFVFDGTNWIMLNPNIITTSELTWLENKLGL